MSSYLCGHSKSKLCQEKCSACQKRIARLAVVNQAEKQKGHKLILKRGQLLGNPFPVVNNCFGFEGIILGFDKYSFVYIRNIANETETVSVE
jgi:hypothetical protein